MRRAVGEGDAGGLDRRGTWVLWRRESGFEGRDLEDRWEGRDLAIGGGDGKRESDVISW